uniref:Fanconi anaemia group A protein C-terminal domain-containing protein n=1 Tax=Hucho hucho TaxID=62062 RepID=A0A4W5JND5_9TELE
MASVSCDCASGEVNKAMSLISLQCPLLLVSAGHWWGRLSPVLVSLWHRLADGQPLPQQLQVLADCHLWVCSSKNGMSCPVPFAPPLLLAACLHCVWEGQGSGKGIRTSPEMLGQLTEQHSQLLVFLLFLCVTDLLTTFLTPQGVKGLQRAQERCKDILTVLVDSADWLLLFKSPSSEKGLYQPVAMVTSDEYTRLMPLAFYSLVPHLNSAVLEKTVKAPGFLHTAVLCYSSLIKLFMDGQTPCPVTEHLTDQMDPSYILTRAQQVLLKTIYLTPPTSLSQHQLNQVTHLCTNHPE